ncbi:MAG: hypothetical protein A7315_12220 [Candidatus Altiarchaeales archaeon WOR_SM1_79]|nr:MAG: hypothetical protein A7315_12220 [Candidatus Altiarchaeales archaeon WOR_SM1_79]
MEKQARIEKENISLIDPTLLVCAGIGIPALQVRIGKSNSRSNSENIAYPPCPQGRFCSNPY